MRKQPTPKKAPNQRSKVLHDYALDRKWLEMRLREQNIRSPRELSIAMGDRRGELLAKVERRERHLHIEDAALVAELLAVPLYEVIKGFGYAVTEPVPPSVPVIGTVSVENYGAGLVEVLPPGVDPPRILAPAGLPSGSEAIRVQNAPAEFGVPDGAHLLYARTPHREDSAITRLSVLEVEGLRNLYVGTLLRTLDTGQADVIMLGDKKTARTPGRVGGAWRVRWIVLGEIDRKSPAPYGTGHSPGEEAPKEGKAQFLSLVSIVGK